MFPTGNLFGNFLATLQTRLTLATHFIKTSALSHHRDPRRFYRHLDVFDLTACRVQIPKITHRFFSRCQSLPRRHRLFFVACNRQSRRLQLAFRQIAIGFRTTGCAIGLSHQTIRIAPRLSCCLIRRGQFGQIGGQCIMRLCSTNRLRVAFFQIAFQLYQSVQLLQPQRRR